MHEVRWSVFVRVRESWGSETGLGLWWLTIKVPKALQLGDRAGAGHPSPASSQTWEWLGAQKMAPEDVEGSPDRP